MGQCPLALLSLGRGAEDRPVEEGAEEVDHAGGAGVARPAAGIAGEVDRERGATVVAAIAREDLGTCRVEASHAHRVLDRLGPPIGEEHVAEALWCPLGDEASRLAADVVGVLRSDGAEATGLLLDGGHDRRVLMADVGVDQLARDVEVLVPVVVVDVAALSSGDDQGVERRLGRPGVEDVAPIVSEDGGLCGGIGDGLHGVTVCHQHRHVPHGRGGARGGDATQWVARSSSRVKMAVILSSWAWRWIWICFASSSTAAASS